MSELEHFRLKSSDLGRLTGVSLAVHAIPDGFLLMHCGVGCKHKATSKLSTHDWARNVVDREGWTEVGDAELIEGSAHRIGPYLRSWQARMNPGVIVVISVTFLDLTGDDFIDEVKQAGDELPSEVMFVKAPGYDGDVHAGYATVVVEVAKRLDWKTPASQPQGVSILGYLFDRYEGDHVGNLTQLRLLLKALGLTLNSSLFSGAPWAALQKAPEAATLLSFPYVHKRTKRLKRITKRAITQVDMPMGIAGTSRWLRTVGEAAGVARSRIDAVVAHKEPRARQMIAMARQRLQGQRVAVFADLPLLGGICNVLTDLGIRPALLGIRGHSLGSADALRALAAKDGIDLDSVPILENPSLVAVRRGVQALLDEGQLDGIIGSATDFNAITTLPQSAFPSGRGPFALEAGFPCKRHHVVRPSPFIGYAGVLGWADRLLNAPRLWDSGR